MNALSSIARESGGLAMLAIDQREALRTMLSVARGTAIEDADLVDFKLNVARELTPHASAVLLDHQFVLDRAVDEGAIDGSCALIASADEFHPGNGIPVDRVTIDEGSSASHAVGVGSRAMKLLVLWRSDESADERLAMVEDFSARCHAENLIAIIEPVVRAPRRGAEFDKEASILAAAEELGDTSADLYKAEMPRGGRGTDRELLDACKALDSRLNTPWVILSSGVDPDHFPQAVRQAVTAGADGFLAGRAVWSCTLPFMDPTLALRDLSVPRMKRLGEVVDEAIAAR